MSDLAEAYDICAAAGMVGPPDDDGLRPLTPPYHDLQKADLEVVLSETTGDMVEATFLRSKENMESLNGRVTVIPVTPKSCQRTNGAEKAPHALHERLDIITHNGYDNAYMENLARWLNSESFHTAPHKEAKAALVTVYRYLERHTMKDDMLALGIDEKDLSGLVRFTIRKDRGLPADYKGIYEYQRLYRDEALWDLYIRYMDEQMEDAPEGLCYATGEVTRLAQAAPKKIISGIENAKILAALSPPTGSVRDPATGRYTYKGTLFASPSDIMQLGMGVVEKSTAMLRWLIDHQGWSVIGSHKVKKADDPEAKVVHRAHRTPIIVWWDKSDPTLALDPEVAYEGAEPYMERFQNPIVDSIFRASRGRHWDETLPEMNDIIAVMTLDNPSIGRISITGYQEIPVSQMLKNITKWHDSIAWEGEPAPNIRKFLVALWDYDFESGGDLTPQAAMVVRQLLACINYHAPLPVNVLHGLCYRAIHTELWKTIASRRRRTDKDIRMLHRFHLDLTRRCLKKAYLDSHKNEEVPAMFQCLDVDCMDRDYLYGRALAHLDFIERVAALKKKDKEAMNRATNAWRMMPAYFTSPESTLRHLVMAINPYVTGNWSQGKWHMKELDRIIAQIAALGVPEPGDIAEKPLGNNAILGYSAQMTALFERKEPAADVNPDNENEEDNSNE